MVVGGGFASAPEGLLAVYASQPTGDEGWLVGGRNPVSSSSSADLYAWALYLRAEPAGAIVAASSRR